MGQGAQKEVIAERSSSRPPIKEEMAKVDDAK